MRGIGISGRQVTDARRTESVLSAAPSSVASSPSPLMRQAVTQLPSEASAGPGAPTARENAAASEIKRETPSLSPQDVAERVYRIFCEELRRERERRGRWG